MASPIGGSRKGAFRFCRDFFYEPGVRLSVQRLLRRTLVRSVTPSTKFNQSCITNTMNDLSRSLLFSGIEKLYMSNNNYIIVSSADIEGLMEKVSAYFHHGWMTQGGVCFSPLENLYMQSMIKQSLYNDEDEGESIEQLTEDQFDEEPKSEPIDASQMKIEELEMSVYAFNRLKSLRINTIGEMVNMDLGKIEFQKIKEEISNLIMEWKQRL